MKHVMLFNIIFVLEMVYFFSSPEKYGMFFANEMFDCEIGRWHLVPAKAVKNTRKNTSYNRPAEALEAELYNTTREIY